MRYTVKAIFLILMFIIQSTLAQHMSIFGVTPNLLLAAVVAVALSSEPAEAACLACGTGVVFDLMFGRVFGMSTLLFTYIALLSRAMLELMYEKTLISTMFITFLAMILYQCINLFLGFVIWGEGDFVFLFFRMILPCAAYTALMQIIIYFVNEKLPFTDGVRGERT